MKANEVIKILKISRPTLCKYVKEGFIRVEILPNTRYNYLDEDVYKFLNKTDFRKNVIYSRVSTQKQKNDLQNQIEMVKIFMNQNGVQLHNIYSDIASGIDFESRKEFFNLLDEVMQNKINKVYISYKDRLSRVGFGLFKKLFSHFGTEIIIISEIGNNKLDSEEVFEEIVSLLHCYSMKLYSKRKRKIVEDLCN